MHDVYTLEYYLAVKKIEITNFARTWIELEKFLLSEITQTQKNKCHMFFVYGGSSCQVLRCEYTACHKSRNQESEPGPLPG